MLDKMNIQSIIYIDIYNLKILHTRKSACELHNPAPLQRVEGLLNAIQWLRLLGHGFIIRSVYHSFDFNEHFFG